jgi:hypothetical protein
MGIFQTEDGHQEHKRGYQGEKEKKRDENNGETI